MDYCNDVELWKHKSRLHPMLGEKNLQNEDWHAARSYCCQKIRLIRLCLNIERDEISCVPLVAGNVCERKLLYNMLPLSCHGNSVLLHLFTTLGAVFALAIVIISVTVVTVTCNEVYHKTATSLSCLQLDLVIKLQQPYSLIQNGGIKSFKVLGVPCL